MTDMATDAQGDLPDTSLFWRWVGRATRPYVGWVLIAIGALAIILGYFGVANEALVAKQMPYVISGGIFGLALVAVGAYYLATEELRSDSRRLDRLERMVLELHTVLLARTDAPAAAASPSGARNDIRLVALRDSQRYHRADCRVVAGKGNVTDVDATMIRRRQLEPCGMCDPSVPAEA
ncbi:MAG: hypothetical protein ACYDH6_07850 [Acidimicrobiales bacterium]